MSKRKHGCLRALVAVIGGACALVVTLALVLATHTQIIVGAIQSLAASTVKTTNTFEPEGEPMDAVRDNGQRIITEIAYADEYPNSFLDITYPDSDTSVRRPTLVYFHGGGFFGGSKSVGDPLASSDVTSLLDDICVAGYNLVNVDYGLVPDCRFPVPVIQANQALAWCAAHAEEYGLDMGDVTIMGSSAGAIITSQLGAVISNPEYAAALGIEPALEPDQVRALVVDDAPLVYDEFSLGAKVLVGNYVRGTIFLSGEEVHLYDATQWVTPAYPPAVLLGSEYVNDMRHMDVALTEVGVAHEIVDPLAERGLEMPHCFVASERTDEVARDAFERTLAFLEEQRA
ncbi:MAG: alpha/beta hydrolase [Atopobiaceae bacterium]|nr:alpha/beta hydrolase [Atopobiaceae bacterium]MBQ6523980.1 alpha/beta hydrolase [Atopobiaceae bacterium]